ncbi:alpha/beta fold hydrolase [Nocardiopsis sp. RSe5-2]|uniref:Alpha/beta fold hydrolase n=1 Tax=Nocardiopsis endophytica TaxID=3018445 RepID=A0ABT4U9K8_9ACTN|nr:alpha/beta fold hydrolase [Nocardiopsis endophytica]MDA2813623.1 alpha/beta fold hydrolase [Nocardiopsis endophytica]
MRADPRADFPEHPTSVTDLTAGRVEYRLHRAGPNAVVVFHGGHMRASLPQGEDAFVDGGRSVLAVSRPGYGRTPASTGTTPERFADAAAELCRRLGLQRVDAVVGISAGGPTAIAMAARHPRLVRSLVLESSVGPLPWPEPAVRRVGRIVFASGAEAATWAGVRGMMRANPLAGLRAMMGGLSTEPPREVVARLPVERRRELAGLFSRMRSGAGFTLDLRATADPRPPTALVAQPALVVASRRDGAVPFAHAEALSEALGAELVESAADGHLIWYSDDHPRIRARIGTFLAKV